MGVLPIAIATMGVLPTHTLAASISLHVGSGVRGEFSNNNYYTLFKLLSAKHWLI